jgi:hypothetical protein
MSGTVDVDEFMAFIYAGDKLKIQSSDTLMHIRKAHAKLNCIDIFDMFRKLP